MARKINPLVKSKPIRFLEELPKHNFVMRRAAKAAGYKDNAANNPSAKILPVVKRVMVELSAEHKGRLYNRDGTISQSLGFTPEELVAEYAKIIRQDKDLSTKLKATTPLLRNLGANIGNDESARVNIPILNITIEEKDGKRELKTIENSEAVFTNEEKSQDENAKNPHEP